MNIPIELIDRVFAGESVSGVARDAGLHAMQVYRAVKSDPRYAKRPDAIGPAGLPGVHKGPEMSAEDKARLAALAARVFAGELTQAEACRQSGFNKMLMSRAVRKADPDNVSASGRLKPRRIRERSQRAREALAKLEEARRALRELGIPDPVQSKP